MRELTRYEMNQKVKTILVRHAVDLTKAHFSCTQHAVHIYGILSRDPKGEFTISELEALAQELERLHFRPRVYFEVENWNITSDMGIWTVHDKKIVSGRQKDLKKALTVEETEEIWEVLKDMK